MAEEEAEQYKRVVIYLIDELWRCFIQNSKFQEKENEKIELKLNL